MADVNVGTLKATLTVDGKQFDEGLKKATDSTKGLDVASANLATGLYNVTTVFALAKDAMKYYTDATISAYTEVKQFNNMTGMSIEQGGKWQDMMENMGMSLSDVTYAFRILSNNIQQAIGDSNSSAGKAFKQLGISLVDANGKMKDSNTIMLETVAALQKMPSGMEKNAIAMDVLGRNYMSLNKLLNDDVSVMERFNKAQSSVTEQGMRNFDNYNEAMNKFNDTLGDLKVAVGDEILPLFVTLLGYATRAIEGFDAILKRVEYFGYLVGEVGRGHITEGSYFTQEEYFTQKSLVLGKSGSKSSSSLGSVLGGSSGSTSGSSTNLDIKKSVEAQIEANWLTMQDLSNSINTKKILQQNYNQEMIDLYKLTAEQQILIESTKNKAMIGMWNKMVSDIRENPAKGVIDIGLLLSTFATKGASSATGGQTGWEQLTGGDSEFSRFMVWMKENTTKTYQESLNIWGQSESGSAYSTIVNAGFLSRTAPIPANMVGAYGASYGRAFGGPVMAGSPYIVGERGAELFVPNTSGSIVPNNALMHVHVDIDGNEIGSAMVDLIRMKTGAKI
jgi:hypothetical protein